MAHSTLHIIHKIGFQPLWNEAIGVSSSKLVCWEKALVWLVFQSLGGNWMLLPTSSKGMAKVQGKAFFLIYCISWLKVLSHSKHSFDFSFFWSTCERPDFPHDARSLMDTDRNTLINLYIHFLTFFSKSLDKFLQGKKKIFKKKKRKADFLTFFSKPSIAVSPFCLAGAIVVQSIISIIADYSNIRILCCCKITFMVCVMFFAFQGKASIFQVKLSTFF